MCAESQQYCRPVAASTVEVCKLSDWHEQERRKRSTRVVKKRETKVRYAAVPIMFCTFAS
jgi:hypothetical protein